MEAYVEEVFKSVRQRNVDENFVRMIRNVVEKCFIYAFGEGYDEGYIDGIDAERERTE